MKSDEITDGYYRVTNNGLSDCYCRVADGYLDININAGTSQNFEALQLYPGLENALSNPSTVIYVKKTNTGSGYDLQAQGMSVEEAAKGSSASWSMTGTTDACVLSATSSGMTLTLWATQDISYYDPHYKATTKSQGIDLYSKWRLIKIDSNTDNYVAIKPRLSVQKDGETKYYAPYYASYPFKILSKTMKVFYVSELGEDYYSLKQITDDIIPAATPVLIECSSTNLADNKIEPLYGDYGTISGNKLSGCYFCNVFVSTNTGRTTFDPSTMRAWNVQDNKLVLSNNTTDYESKIRPDVTGYYLFANESYINIPVGTTAEATLYDTPPSKIRTIVVDNSSSTISYNQEGVVTVTVTDAEAAAGKTVTASSSNTNVATVTAQAVLDDNGRAQFTITPTTTTGGTATITFSILGANGSTLTATTVVTVPKTRIEAVSVDNESLSIYKDNTKQITITALPAYASKGKTVIASSSDNSAVSIDQTSLTLDDNGQATFTIRGNVVGDATISFAVESTDIIAQSSVSIKELPVERISVDNNTLSIPYHSTKTVTLTASPANVAKGKIVSVTYSQKEVVSTTESQKLNESGQASFIIKGETIGETTISFSVDGVSASTVVTVVPADVTLTVDQPTATIEKGESSTVTVTANAAAAVNGKKLQVASSNSDIVACDNEATFNSDGIATVLLSAKKNGTAIITYSINDTDLKGISTTTTVTVPHADSIMVNITKLEIPQLGKSSITVSALPVEKFAGKTVTVSSFDPDLVTMNNTTYTLNADAEVKVEIEGKAFGTTNLTFTLDDAKGQTASTKVTLPEYKVPAPESDLQTGSLFYNGKMVELKLSSPKETTYSTPIYYTTDGSDPRSSDSRKEYREAIILTSDIAIKAVAEDTKHIQSDIFEASYILAKNTEGVSLNTGWNWVSFNMKSDKLKNYDTMLGTGTWYDGDEIKDKYTFLDYYSKDGKWYGTMQATTEMTNGSRYGMVKIFSKNSQMLNITGEALDPASCAVNISSGWNYLAYTPIVSLSVDEALQGYKQFAKDGDMIKSLKNGSATFHESEGKWGEEGGLTTLEPGEGYMLFRKDFTTAVPPFCYPVTYPIFLASSSAKAATISLFSGNMNIIAAIDSEDIQEGDVIVAIANGEVRGTAIVKEDKKVVLTIAGDEPTDVTLTAERDGETIANSKMSFSYKTDDIIGSWANPTPVTFVNADDNDATAGSDIEVAYGIDGKSYGNTKSLPNGTYIIKNGTGTSKIIKR